MEQLLRDAKTLVQRLQSHDNSADALIGDATHLQNKLHAMKQYRDEVFKLNEMAKHRPKSTLILGSQLENQRIQELELEVGELTVSLAEHQSALELIMNKYREQVLALLETNGLDKGFLEQLNKEAEDVQGMKDKILEMAAIMQKAMQIDDASANGEIEAHQSLKAENETLRELLQISSRSATDTSTVIRRKPNSAKVGRSAREESQVAEPQQKTKELLKPTDGDLTDTSERSDTPYPDPTPLEEPTNLERSSPVEDRITEDTVRHELAEDKSEPSVSPPENDTRERLEDAGEKEQDSPKLDDVVLSVADEPVTTNTPDNGPASDDITYCNKSVYSESPEPSAETTEVELASPSKESDSNPRHSSAEVDHGSVDENTDRGDNGKVDQTVEDALQMLDNTLLGNEDNDPDEENDAS